MDWIDWKLVGALVAAGAMGVLVWMGGTGPVLPYLLPLLTFVLAYGALALVEFTLERTRGPTY